MAFFGGTADIHGAVSLTAGSRVVTSSAGSVTTFFDDVVHNGLEIFTGTGTVYYIGDMRPGNSPADVNYGGDLVFSSAASLTLEIRGTTPGSQYDRLTIAGSASLDGILDVSLTNGFTPNGGQQFTTLTAGSIVNNGFVLTGSAASSFNLLVKGTSVILQAIGLASNYNLDGAVDAADYVVWRKGLGTIYAQTDYDVWRAHFGQTPGSGASSALPLPPSALESAVPEPPTLAMLFAAGWITMISWCNRSPRSVSVSR